MNPAPQILSISAGLPFARTLAAWVVARFGASPDALARVRILLPNRRSCQTLRAAFLEISGGVPMLLPQIHPIGDWETESLPADLLSADILRDIPPAIDPNRRLLLLTRLVMQFEKSRDRVPHTAQAVQLARQLGRFLDDIARENVDIHSLAKLAPAELAEHWQQTVEFLEIVSKHWPRLLYDEQLLDPVDQRNQVLRAIAATWKHTPPAYPVIAAGSTGTQPATAELLSAIARLPQGTVILPGLDQKMPDSEWDILSPTHPQYALKELLASMGVVRQQIENIQEKTRHIARIQCLQTIFQPPAATSGWSKVDLPLPEGMRGIQLIVADSPADEARMIAVALRKTVDTPGKTAALVTPDRDLARRVVSQMQRFGIAVDDSAGEPLLDTPPGVLLRLVAEFLISKASPVSVLAILRHPLAAAGREASQCRALSRILDKEYLRGVRPAPGLKPLRMGIKNTHPELGLLLSELETQAKTFTHWLSTKKPIAPRELLQEHIRLTQWLASTTQETGENRLWMGDTGNQLATALAELSPHLDTLPVIDPQSYPAFFEALLGDKMFRPRYGKHPRLHILSPIEARLQSYDRVILGSLNEEMWPARPVADPWMSRPMREAFGLPPLERSIGQSAQDFFQLVASAEEILLTRAKKSEGKPTVPSRWLVRMETLLAGKDQKTFEKISDHSFYEQAKTIIDKPAQILPIVRPEPKPPLSARPRRINATAVETWQRDPYMIYAKHILKLKALRKLDEEPGPADFGTLVHDTLKHFADRFPENLPQNAYDELLISGREVFDKLLNRPAVATLWWPRFEALAAWFIEHDRERREQGLRIVTEREGSWPLDVDGESFTLTTRIDRLEIAADGNAAIVDYKTGSLPNNTDIKNGLAAQLPMEGLIAAIGALNPPLPSVTVNGLEYWRLAGSEDYCEIKSLGSPEEVSMLLDNCRLMLEALVRAYASPDQAYAAQTNVKLTPRYNDYEHLTRRKEWGEA
jgi:ATP-dependent helicase/nuclease subunit B